MFSFESHQERRADIITSTSTSDLCFGTRYVLTSTHSPATDHPAVRKALLLHMVCVEPAHVSTGRNPHMVEDQLLLFRDILKAKLNVHASGGQ